MPAATASNGLRSALRARLRSWALRRQGPDVLPVQLSARRVYILPTAAGWTFALLLGVMFIAGMNYGNGLALLFTFWLTGFALVAMVQTQRGLTGIVITAATAESAHAGESIALRVQVAGTRAPQDLQIAAGGARASGAPRNGGRVDGPGGAPIPGVTGKHDDGAEALRGELTLRLPGARRGRWRAPPLRLSTMAPFGLFEAWTWLALDVQALVYPAARGARPEPHSAGRGAGPTRHQHGQDELAWLRDFREGDSPRQVAWKAYARGQPLLVREYQDEGALRQQFDFDALQDLNVEARLEQLARWVVDADARGGSWTLRLPGLPALSGQGSSHRLRCLTHLALHGIEAPP